MIPPPSEHCAQAEVQTYTHKRTKTISRIASLQLDFLIVGGGIAGLGVAFTLARAGHRVRVLEKAPRLGRKAAGVRVPPNLSKILVEWGLGDALKACAVRCRGSPFFSLETGEQIGWLAWDDDVMKETGGSFWLMRHEDLHRMMYELATSAGARVDFGVEIVGVYTGQDQDCECDEDGDEDEDRKPCVKLRSGQRISADIIIGADGLKSRVRSAVLGGEIVGESTGSTVYTATIPMSAMRADPELAELSRQPEWPMWMGDGRNILGYPIHPEHAYNVHLFWPSGDEDGEEVWEQEVEMNLTFEGCHPSVQKLMGLVRTAFRTEIVRREMVEEWVDASGRIVLIGDAAHPMVPGSSHGCSLALEDAVVFGTLFSRLNNWDQVAQLLEAFVELRQARCMAVNTREAENKALMEYPPGPARDARDTAMREAMSARHERWDDTKLRMQWEEIAAPLAYNAFDAAEDWYVSWGALTEASKQRNAYGESLDLHMAIERTQTVDVGG